MKGKTILFALALALAIPATAGAGTNDAKLSTLGIRVIDASKAFSGCPADARVDTGAPRAPSCVKAALAIAKTDGAVLKYLNGRIKAGTIRRGTPCGRVNVLLAKTNAPDVAIGDWILWTAPKNKVLAGQMKFVTVMLKVYETC